MVRAVLIDPHERVVSETALPEYWNDIRRRLDTRKLIRVATLPAGDGVYVTEEADGSAKFRLGHSASFSGCAVVLGRRGRFGSFSDAFTDTADVEALTDFDPSDAAVEAK